MALSKFRPMATYHAAGAIGNFIAQSDGIVYILSHNAIFSVPPVTYVTANARIAALQISETLATTKVTGAAAARDVDFNLVLTNMRIYKTYVQNLADLASNRMDAIAIIKASGFGLKVDGVTVKAPLSVRPGGSSGEVILTSKAARMKALYNWQIGIEVAGIVIWTDLPSSLKSKVAVGSLTAGVRTFFRNRILTRKGLTAWSVAVTIIPQ